MFVYIISHKQNGLLKNARIYPILQNICIGFNLPQGQLKRKAVKMGHDLNLFSDILLPICFIVPLF